MIFEIPADFELQDDLSVALDPAEYQDAPIPMPILAGNYGVRIKKMGLAKRYGTDEVILVKDENGVPTFPILSIQELEVAAPDEVAGRRVFPMGFGQEFGTKPFTGKDFQGNSYPRNNLAEILRSHDVNIAFRGTKEGMKTLERLVNEGAIFYVKLNWVAEDRTYIKEQIELLKAAHEDGQLDDEEFRTKANKVRYREGRQEGMNKFADSNGNLNPVWVGPSGEEVEARAFIREFISQANLGRVKLGPMKVRASKANVN